MTQAPSRPQALTQLVLTRFREFLREPESVFWIFVFPILMASGLGIAFRSRPAEVVRVAVVTSCPASECVRQALTAQPGFSVESVTEAEADRALRIGRVALAVVPQDNGGLVYRYDKVRAERGRRASWRTRFSSGPPAGRTHGQPRTCS